MPDKKSVTIEECFDNIRTYIKKPENIELLERAWAFAQKAHAGQFRKSGEPYTIHVIQVANILASLHCSPSVIAAGLLHDTLEDCEWVTHEMLEKEFSPKIAELVESVTKINNMKHEFKNEEEYQARNHRKIFMAMVADIRVVLIKLADRLHNMRTLQYQKPEKQKKIAQETLTVYAPLAHRLGISHIKTELEDLSFKYLEPEEYQKIKGLVAEREESRKAQIQEMMTDIETILQYHSIPYRIFGRSKHFYSIYKKMKTKNKRFEEILDLQAIRIVTDTPMHCYEILGYIHATYRPMPGRFKDYIAMPKNNRYQSLHTTVVDPSSGHIFEIQIRTEEMDEVAEQGVAAHWFYKENGPNPDDHQPMQLEDKLSWFRDFAIITDEDNEDPLEYTLAIQKDIFEANVCCFTPRGDMIDLPAGSTPIDFAYRIHTEVGHRAVGALVNNVMVPLNTILKTGDIVQIKTSKLSNGPSRDWLNVVQSPHARSKIRQFFQKKDQAERKEALRTGQSILESELKNNNLEPNVLKREPKKLEMALTGLPYRNLEELLVALGTKQLSPTTIIARLQISDAFLDHSSNEEIIKRFTPAEPKRKVADCGISVAGIDSIQVSLAPCCTPIPGDDVIGYITKGKGIKVHRTDCPNIQKKKERLINVEWADDLEPRPYAVNLTIESSDRDGIVADFLGVFKQTNVPLTSISSNCVERYVSALTNVTIEVKNHDELERVLSNLRKIPEVNDVKRRIL